ncbi:Nucleoside diphosphate kinase 2, chloroplastic [Morella rubra]|uniref:Nucleoside diphosphate kinase n=1 Tax=Morella rubra TaxID=262757 RepID=A0A6A1VX16_9ROSI|nr:Nucleoside diphosphate kinase 2, chloroplastic [Morella rubra]
MEARTVFGGTSSLSSSLARSSTRRACSLFYPHTPLLRTTHHLHLAAFHPKSHLFSYFPSRPHAKTLSHTTKPHIFLPHLVASMEQVEETYIMVKPDGVQRGLVGEIISRFEKKGFKLTGLKLFQCPKDLAEVVEDVMNLEHYKGMLSPAMLLDNRQHNNFANFISLIEHYKDLKAKSFFPKLIKYITSGPVVCMAWEGVGVVASARKLIGSTDPLQADPGTIRGDLAVQTGRNVIHGSDSPENGKREIALWFEEGELCQWTPAQAPWLRE